MKYSNSLSTEHTYTLNETGGVSKIIFRGDIGTDEDINVATIPVGGVIVSVASTEGFNYQPLVAAGGTAIISAGGTITSVSIGNSGSGYRAFTPAVKAKWYIFDSVCPSSICYFHNFFIVQNIDWYCGN